MAKEDIERACCRLSTVHGEFLLHGFLEAEARLEHAALCFGDVNQGGPVLVRLHSECLTGDAFGSCHCDCGPQLRSALQAIAQEGRGILLYLRQEGRGIGLLNKIRAYALQEKGADTLDANRFLGLPADARDYAFAARMQLALGVSSVRLMTNNPEKITGLEAHGINISERVSVRRFASHSRQAGWITSHFATPSPSTARLAPNNGCRSRTQTVCASFGQQQHQHRLEVQVDVSNRLSQPGSVQVRTLGAGVNGRKTAPAIANLEAWLRRA